MYAGGRTPVLPGIATALTERATATNYGVVPELPPGMTVPGE